MQKKHAPWIISGLLFAVAWFFFYSGGSSSSEAFAYQHDWLKAREEARVAKKPILLSFGGSWCPSCVKLETTVFADERIQKLSKEFICIKVDPRDPGASKEALDYKTTRYVPEVMFLSPTGEVLEELERAPAGQVAEQMQAILESLKKKSRS